MAGEGAELPRYTWEEIRQHNNASSLWVVIENKIYDVTKFASEHPGGEDVLLENAGTDATVPFTDIGHSYDAIELRKTYLLGIVSDVIPPEPEIEPEAKPKPPRVATTSWWLPALAVVALAVGIVVAYKIWKK